MKQGISFYLGGAVLTVFLLGETLPPGDVDGTACIADLASVAPRLLQTGFARIRSFVRT